MLYRVPYNQHNIIVWTLFDYCRCLFYNDNILFKNSNIIINYTSTENLYHVCIVLWQKIRQMHFCILIRVTSKSVKTNGHQLITILQSIAVLSILEKKMFLDVEYLSLVISSKSISYIPTSVSA